MNTRTPFSRSLVRLAALLAVPLLAAGCGGGSSGSSESPSGSTPAPSGSTAGLADPGCSLSYASAVPVPAPGTGTDPMLVEQWHLRNNGTITGIAGEDVRALETWPTTRGANARVAVVDDAVEVTHQDLAPNVVPGGSYDYRPASRGGAYPMPCSASDSHGTAVAGIVSGRDDDATGGAGVAPRSSLVGYNALATGTTADIVDALNRALDLNMVYNNSWGSPDDGMLHEASPSFVSAIRSGIDTGRGGKGAIYVFPSGNGGCYNPDDGSPCERENSNNDGYVNQLGVITACATDSSGKQPRYGERGANILLCGPSSGETAASKIRTTALRNGYRSDFTGTSASTPMVSGVAALVLAANPNLTWRDVRLLLARTARRNDPTDSEWSDAYGLHFNPKYGFGVADAKTAVAAAPGWTSVGNSSTLVTCGPYTVQPRAALPDPAGGVVTPVSSTINAAPCGIQAIEFIAVRVTATHTSSGDLTIRLISPAGLISELADAHNCYNGLRLVSCGDLDNVHFGTVRHLDEPVATGGNAGWALQITDMAALDTGSFDQWSITFYGR